MKNLVTFNDLLSKSSAAGRNVPYNIQQAVLNGKMSPKNAVAEMKRLMIAEADSAASGMNKEGKDASASFNSGVNANKSGAKTAGNNLNTEGKKGAGSKTMYDEGSNAGSGFISGIGKWIGAAWDAGWNLVSNAISGGKKRQNSHSPSRVWDEEVGQMSGAGYVIGLQKSEKSVNKAAAHMVGGAIDTVKGMSNDLTVGDMFNMGNLKAGLNSNINSIQKSRMLRSSANQQTATPKNITFNQYNNSPKPLSRLDIYRQTKTQLIGAKEKLKDV